MLLVLPSSTKPRTKHNAPTGWLTEMSTAHLFYFITPSFRLLINKWINNDRIPWEDFQKYQNPICFGKLEGTTFSGWISWYSRQVDDDWFNAVQRFNWHEWLPCYLQMQKKKPWEGSSVAWNEENAPMWCRGQEVEHAAAKSSCLFPTWEHVARVEMGNEGLLLLSFWFTMLGSGCG